MFVSRRAIDCMNFIKLQSFRLGKSKFSVFLKISNYEADVFIFLFLVQNKIYCLKKS